MIGKNIQEIRIKKGLTLSELAEKANISKSYLSNIERELNDNPSIQVVEKISKVLGVEFRTLLGTNIENNKLENDYIDLIKELVEIGIGREELREYKKVFEFVKWKNSKNH
ncbi:MULTISPECIES: helix-turn-helix transcriptional regulator [Bacillaceae]|jgi:XRE family transcriptional regulator, master regulator for biofilm formation|uniref:Transcriptional regulator n=1 Tax=Gottfriedia luciferensis TaxID=178774 RepID=A0ABX2ZQK0_9BACI|nr:MULTISPECIES: helix-turn-helix transcriptional regulator [Bacillaceae]ODG91997.1 transcriptional regulator [Gottfriedia luciferensis]PGZ87577.1 XRE family transcriptional regulator [Bacillus sp. AFS029533]SFD17359.1 Transcriptional regulator, contains XRE-family HTH domain [Bacillus sp. UNCCL81]